MKKIFYAIMLTFLLPFAAYAECHEETKAKVDSLKGAIPYPKWNISDTAYIAFINDPKVGTNNFTDNDIIIIKVKIVDMMLFNSIGGPNYTEGLYLQSSPSTFPVRWKYQYIDTSIKNPKYGDRSDFYSEERFQRTPNEAKIELKKSLKE